MKTSFRIKFVFVFLLIPSWSYAQETLIKLCFNIYPPYTIGTLDSTIAHGIKVDIAKAIMKEMGIPLKVIYLPWARCQMEVKLGRIDGVLPAFKNKAREEYSVFTNVVRTQTSVFFYNKQRFPNGVTWDSTSELLNYSISMIRASTMDEKLESEYQQQRAIYYLKDLEHLLKHLNVGRTDLAALDKRVGEYHIAKKPDYINLYATEQIIGKRTTHLAISKASPFVQRMGEFNRVIAKLRRMGTIQRIVNSY
jgi:polar amino acid transport system substrate-binding protein